MMRKIQLSVMLIALCLLFATYASALKPRFSPRKIHPAWLRQNPFDYWRDRLKSLPLSDAKAEKPNWRKVGEKLARLGQAAANLGAIRNLFLSEAEAEADAEFRSWPPTGPWGTPPYVPRGLSDAEGPWGTVYNPNPRPYLLSDAEAEFRCIPQWILQRKYNEKREEAKIATTALNDDGMEEFAENTDWRVGQNVHPAWLRQNPFGYWRDRLNTLPLSEAEAEKVNWKKVGEKIAGIGQAAANLGAIKALFLDDDAVGVEDVDWRQGPWIVHHPLVPLCCDAQTIILWYRNNNYY